MFLYLVIALLILVYYVSTKKFNYFKDKKVPHIKPTFLLGNYGDVILQKKSLAEVVQDLCKQFPGEPYIGAYYSTEPVLIPMDPEVIKLIMTKDFYYFHGREMSDHMHREPATTNLFISSGDTWKVLRQNMTPLFSSGKMKNMFHLIKKCAYVYESMLDKEVSMSRELEVRGLTAKFTIECIAACAFGVNANTMTEDPKTNVFAKIAASLFDSPRLLYYLRFLRTTWPSIFYALRLKVFSAQFKFFNTLITSIMSSRNYKPSGKHDFVDLVLSWKQSNQITGDSIKIFKNGEGQKITLPATDDLLVAQVFVFFFGGFETSSTTLSYTLYEFAKHPEIQKKVLEEIDAYMIRHNNKLDYDCLTELTYLDACIDETLRIYPVLGVNLREQMENYTMPNGVRLDKGLRVHIPVYYLHHNPKYFPDPEKYRPERFYGEAKKNIVPYTYMPFGEGPRTCIGMRFAKMQMMAGFITMLKKYRVELGDSMPLKLTFKPETFFTHPKGGIHLTFIEREGWERKVYVQ